MYAQEIKSATFSLVPRPLFSVFICGGINKNGKKAVWERDYATLYMGTDLGRCNFCQTESVSHGGLILARGDHFWQPKIAKVVRVTGLAGFFAKIGPAGPVLGGTNFGVTGHLIYLR